MILLPLKRLLEAEFDSISMPEIACIGPGFYRICALFFEEPEKPFHKGSAVFQVFIYLLNSDIFDRIWRNVFRSF